MTPKQECHKLWHFTLLITGGPGRHSWTHPILVTPWILDQMLAMVWRRAFRLLRERVPRQLCNRLLHNCRGAPPTGSVRCSAWQKFVASLSQIAPIGPVLPTQPSRKCCAVYNLRFNSFHGMEEVIGSI